MEKDEARSAKVSKLFFRKVRCVYMCWNASRVMVAVVCSLTLTNDTAKRLHFFLC